MSFSWHGIKKIGKDADLQKATIDDTEKKKERKATYLKEMISSIISWHFSRAFSRPKNLIQMIERQLSDTCSEIQEEQTVKQFEKRSLQKIRPLCWRLGAAEASVLK